MKATFILLVLRISHRKAGARVLLSLIRLLGKIEVFHNNFNGS